MATNSYEQIQYVEEDDDTLVSSTAARLKLLRRQQNRGMHIQNQDSGDFYQECQKSRNFINVKSGHGNVSNQESEDEIMLNQTNIMNKRQSRLNLIKNNSDSYQIPALTHSSLSNISPYPKRGQSFLSQNEGSTTTLQLTNNRFSSGEDPYEASSFPQNKYKVMERLETQNTPPIKRQESFSNHDPRKFQNINRANSGVRQIQNPAKIYRNQQQNEQLPEQIKGQQQNFQETMSLPHNLLPQEFVSQKQNRALSLVQSLQMQSQQLSEQEQLKIQLQQEIIQNQLNFQQNDRQQLILNEIDKEVQEVNQKNQIKAIGRTARFAQIQQIDQNPERNNASMTVKQTKAIKLQSLAPQCDQPMQMISPKQSMVELQQAPPSRPRTSRKRPESAAKRVIIQQQQMPAQIFQDQTVQVLNLENVYQRPTQVHSKFSPKNEDPQVTKQSRQSSLSNVRKRIWHNQNQSGKKLNSQLTVANHPPFPLEETLDYPQMLHQTQGSELQQDLQNYENHMDSQSFHIEPTIKTQESQKVVQKMVLKKDQIHLLDEGQQKTIKITKISGSQIKFANVIQQQQQQPPSLSNVQVKSAKPMKIKMGQIMFNQNFKEQVMESGADPSQ